MSDVIVRKCHVYQAINEVKQELARHGGITKDRQAPAGAGGYVFRGIDDMFNVLCGITARAGLVMIPRTVHKELREGKTAAGKAQIHAIIEMEVDYCSAVDGSVHTGRFIGEAMDTGDKASNKAMAAAFKYAHLHAFQIPTHGEDDTEAYAPDFASRQQQAPATANGKGPGPAKASPTQAIRDEAKQQAPVNLPPPAGTHPAPAPSSAPQLGGNKSLAAAAMQAHTFDVLHTMAKQAHTEGADDTTWHAIRSRVEQLLLQAPDIATLKASKDLVRDLGSPDFLVKAANVRFQQLNNVQQPGGR